MAALWIILTCVCALTAAWVALTIAAEILLRGRRGRWRPGTATVTGHVSRRTGSGPPFYLPVTSRYAVASYRDAEGNEHTLEVADGPIGQELPILFDPRRPARGCADQSAWSRSTLLLAAVAAISGLLLLYLVPAPWSHGG